LPGRLFPQKLESNQYFGVIASEIDSTRDVASLSNTTALLSSPPSWPEIRSWQADPFGVPPDEQGKRRPHRQVEAVLESGQDLGVAAHGRRSRHRPARGLLSVGCRWTAAHRCPSQWRH